MNCAQRKIRQNKSTLAPCSVLSNSFEWDINSSCYSGSKKWIKKWEENSIEESLTSCCKLLRSIFNYENIADIFQIMKFSLSQPMPKTLKEISEIESQDELDDLVPNKGNFTALKTLGYVSDLFLHRFNER